MSEDKKTTRLNVEKTISNDRFRLKIGTINKLDPQVIYIDGKTFVKPLFEKDNYSTDIAQMKREFSKIIFNTLNETTFNNRYILDFQIAKNGFSTEKKTFLSFQLLIKQNSPLKYVKLKEIKEATEPIITKIVSEFGDSVENSNFAISKTKK